MAWQLLSDSMTIPKHLLDKNTLLFLWFIQGPNPKSKWNGEPNYSDYDAFDVLLSSMVLVILMKMVCVVLAWETETKSDTRTPLISLLQCTVAHPFHIVQFYISPPIKFYMYHSVQVEGHLLVFWAQKHWTWIGFWAECNLDQSHQSQCHRVSH